MTERHDYYRVLHVDQDAPDELIKASYRTLMQRMKMHPDLGGDHAAATLINEAFGILGHPERRAAYDVWLRAVARNRPDAKTPETTKAPASESTTACRFCHTVHSPVHENDLDRVCASCGASIFPVQHHRSDDQSRRTIGRLPRFMRVTFLRGNAEAGMCRGITQDISLAGMRLLTHAPLTEGTRLLIECEFCSAVGTVKSVRRHAVDADGWEVGVQFSTMRLKRHRGSLISTVA